MEVKQDATHLVDGDRLADRRDRDIHRHLLLEVDDKQVDVNRLAADRMFLDRLTKPPKGAPKEMVAEKSTLPHDQALAAAGVSQADVDEFRRAIDPLASAGKLGEFVVGETTGGALS